jgi:predicted enzyme related to lactoylglutathione lyase
MAGEVVHIEFVAADADRAQRFWSGLFGWEFAGSGMPDMDYRMAQTGPGSGAAIYASDTRDGHPKYYFDTGDIDASAAKVRELGGRADDKQPVPGHGWFAACADSEGNEFHLWQADSSAAPPA